MNLRALRFLALAVCTAAQAYNPAVDTSGPVTARILEPSIGLYGAGGPTSLTRTGVPFSLAVTLENSAGETVQGTLRLAVIDQWRAEPAEQPFSLAPKGRARLQFQITVGEGSFNGHYPIHAFAEFDWHGGHNAAHPVLILLTQLPDPPRAHPPLAWSPIPVPTRGEMGLWRLPVRREYLTTRRSTSETGAIDSYEAAAAIRYGVRIEGREAVGMTLGLRPPSSAERIQAAAVEYPLALPAGTPVRLRFENYLSGKAPASFRAEVLPFDGTGAARVVFEKTVSPGQVVPGDADLTGFAGRKIRLRLEASGDEGQGYWAEPALSAGAPEVPQAFPPDSQNGSRLLGTVDRGGQHYEVRVWPGRRGLLDAAVGFTQGNTRLLFHGFRVRVLGDRLDDSRSAATLLEAREESAVNPVRVRHRFRAFAGDFDLVVELRVEHNALVAGFHLENVPPPRPWLAVYLEGVSAGPWTGDARRVYAGLGNVIEHPGAFQLPFDGHRLATSFVGFDFPGISLVEALDTPPERLEVDPAAHIYSLDTPHTQTLHFLPSPDVWQGVRAWRELSGMRAAAGVPRLAGRFVFDLWSGRYAESAAALEHAFRYGLTDAVVVWHNWQRWGYDYRLPDIFPPSPQWGTEQEFLGLARVCAGRGVLFAPHDNYIDFYPDAQGFTYSDVAFQPDGQPRRAWYNSGRQAQSYRFRADRLRPYLERNLKAIKDTIAPTAYFIDVWSSMGPYDYWSSDGRFFPRTVTRQVWRDAFAWIRDYLGRDAPQISEAGHDQLIGWLDGAQANHLRVQAPPAQGFLWSIPNSDAERIPWEDAAYHDRFVLHGAGYPDRYAAGLDRRSHGISSDDYIATEVLTGHPAMVSAPFGRDVVRKYWLLHDLMRALALGRIGSVEFSGDNIHRQRVSWENGGSVWVNRGGQDWLAEGHTLPQYGFYARIPTSEGTVESAIERRDGIIVEWSKSPASVYANARPVVLEREGRGYQQESGPDPRPARMNPAARPIPFEAATTNGGFRVVRQGDAILLTPLPSSPRFIARLHWSALPWKSPLPSSASAIDEQGRILRSAPLGRAGDEVSLECQPGVFAYRLN